MAKGVCQSLGTILCVILCVRGLRSTLCVWQAHVSGGEYGFTTVLGFLIDALLVCCALKHQLL